LAGRFVLNCIHTQIKIVFTHKRIHMHQKIHMRKQKLNCTHIIKLNTNVHTQNKIYGHTQNKYTRTETKIAHKTKLHAHTPNKLHTDTYTYTQTLHTTPNCAQIHTHSKDALKSRLHTHALTKQNYTHKTKLRAHT